jgi:hypothetical protein
VQNTVYLDHFSLCMCHQHSFMHCNLTQQCCDTLHTQCSADTRTNAVCTYQCPAYTMHVYDSTQTNHLSQQRMALQAEATARGLARVQVLLVELARHTLALALFHTRMPLQRLALTTAISLLCWLVAAAATAVLALAVVLLVAREAGC